MSTQKVVWQEGMLLRPQHFQQNDRYYDYQLKVRTQRQTGCSWGLFQLEIDHQFLTTGKLVISQASGILPDGTEKPLATVTWNYQRLRRHTFDPIKLKAIRLDITASHGEEARLYEIRAYT